MKLCWMPLSMLLVLACRSAPEPLPERPPEDPAPPIETAPPPAPRRSPKAQPKGCVLTYFWNVDCSPCVTSLNEVSQLLPALNDYLVQVRLIAEGPQDGRAQRQVASMANGVELIERDEQGACTEKRRLRVRCNLESQAALVLGSGQRRLLTQPGVLDASRAQQVRERVFHHCPRKGDDALPSD